MTAELRTISALIETPLQGNRRNAAAKAKTRLDRPLLHAKHGSMQKMQILFPEPLMAKIRCLAQEEDRPVSEVIRRAVETFLEMKPAKPKQARQLPTFRGGEILVSAENLKENLYDNGPL
jgi:hypothetical protein